VATVTAAGQEGENEAAPLSSVASITAVGVKAAQSAAPLSAVAEIVATGQAELAPVSHVYETRAGYPDKRKRKKRHDETGVEAVLRAPVIPVTPELISALNNEPPSVPTQLFPLTAPQIVAGVDEDEDELLLMLAA
jgi:hypothetical protein